MTQTLPIDPSAPLSGANTREVRAAILLGALTAALLVLIILSLLVGRRTSGVGGLIDLFATDPETAWLIFSEVRLPRTMLTVIVGATLGLSGAVLQGVLRNPLAEPALLGASSSAALGAVVMFYFGVSGAFGFALPLGGMVGTLAATALLFILGGRAQDTLTLILAGVAINSLTAALTSLALNFAPSPYAALEIVFWILGSFADRSMEHVWLALAPSLVGWALLLGLGRALDALTLGEDTAATLGFDVPAVKRRAIIGAACAVGAAVSVTGVISFVGLVVPHVLRPLVGYRPSRLLAASTIGGAVLMTAADIGVRALTATVTGLELKVGVLTALIGAPFFLHLLLVLRRAGT
ncbi:MAG: iron ABC transporter permease [Rhodospirillaceae bacterium]|nr:iron ABC transporter permease [Rhodospirillaceae bacterium]